jgi:hypothetical protein
LRISVSSSIESVSASWSNVRSPAAARAA